MQLESRELTVVQRAAVALSKEETETELKALASQSRMIVAVTDSDSREVCHESMMLLKNMRLLVQRRAKRAREEAQDYSKTVISIERELIALIEPEETRLEGIRDEWDSAKKRERQALIEAEINRVAEIQRRIDGVRNWPVNAAGKPSILIDQMLAQAQSFRVEAEVFQERCDEAVAALALSTAALAGLLRDRRDYEAAQEQLKRDQEELAQRRAADAELERIAKVERDRIAKEARDKQAADARAHAEQVRKDREETARVAEEQRRANAEEAGRLTAAREALEREQEALRKAKEPKPKPHKAPSGAELAEVVAKHYSVTAKVARQWLLKIDWTEAKAS